MLELIFLEYSSNQLFFFQKMHFFFRTFVTAFTYRKVYRQSLDFFGGSIKIWASRKYNKIANRTHERSSFITDFTLKVRNCRILASGPFALQPYYSRGRIVNSTLRVTVHRLPDSNSAAAWSLLERAVNRQPGLPPGGLVEQNFDL